MNIKVVNQQKDIVRVIINDPTIIEVANMEIQQEQQNAKQ